MVTNSKLYSKIGGMHKQMREDNVERLEQLHQIRTMERKLLDSSATSQIESKDDVEEVDQ